MGRTQRFSPPRITGAVALVALIVAMVLNTRFVTPEELATIGPERFDPRATAAELFTEANKTLPGKATPLSELLEGVQQDIPATAARHDAARPNDTTYMFPVEGEATVVATQAQAIEVRVDGVPPRTPLSIATGPAVNGTVLRDALGFQFGDAPNQSTYQQVGDALKTMIQKQIRGADEARKGDTLRFVGVAAVTDTGIPQSPAKPVSIQPLSLEVAR